MADKPEETTEEEAPAEESTEVVNADDETIDADWLKREAVEAAKHIKTRLFKPIFKATRSFFDDLKDDEEVGKK